MKNTNNIYEVFRQHEKLRNETEYLSDLEFKAFDTEYLSDLTFEVFDNNFLELLHHEALKAACNNKFVFESIIFCDRLKAEINIYEMIEYIRNIPGIVFADTSRIQFENGDVRRIIRIEANTLQIADYIYGEMQRKEYEEQTSISR